MPQKITKVDDKVDNAIFYLNVRNIVAANDSLECERLLISFLNELNFGEGELQYNDDKEYYPDKQRRSRIVVCETRYKRNSEEDNPDWSFSLPNAVWKSAFDQTTGRKYYYDAITRRSQWTKPASLRAREKRKRQEQKRLAKQFFDEMENNILNSLARGVIPGISSHKDFITNDKSMSLTDHAQIPLTGNPHVRTISGMNGVLEAALESGSPCTKNYFESSSSSNATSYPPTVANQTISKTIAPIVGRPPLPGIRNANDIGHNHSTKRPRNYCFDGNSTRSTEIPSEQGKKHSSNNEFKNCSGLNLKNGHIRRNTTQTIYLQNSMTNPNINATIKCVCAVYRAHILQSREKSRKLSHKLISREYDVFDDNYESPELYRTSSTSRRKRKVPSLLEIFEFYEAFYQRSQMEHDTIITSLIYAERVIKLTNANLVPTIKNWRSLLFSTMMLSSKVWDDFSMWNIDFSNVTAHTAGLSSFTLYRINELELALLKCLNFIVKIPASEYAKYYFLIRNMNLQSGLVKESGRPLGKKEAFEKFESLSSPHCDTISGGETRDRRTKSMDGSIFNGLKYTGEPVLKDFVCLEQLVKNQ